MQFSQHAGQRMNQRGISRRLVEFALRHGHLEGNKHVLDRKTSLKLIDELNEQLRLAKQVLDKGGVTVVEGDDTVITAYNVSTPARRARNGGQHP
jgi:RNA binding exosome subunit